MPDPTPEPAPAEGPRVTVAHITSMGVWQVRALWPSGLQLVSGLQGTPEDAERVAVLTAGELPGSVLDLRGARP